MEYNVERAKAAINYLATLTYYAQVWRKIVAAAARPDSEPFTGEQEVLNELVHIGRQHKKALANLYELLKSKRSDKTDYQREFMANKRRRDNKAIKLEEAMIGRKLVLEERQAFLTTKYIHWNKQRDAILQNHSDVSWEERNDILKAFWAEEEMKIDAGLKDFS